MQIEERIRIFNRALALAHALMPDSVKDATSDISERVAIAIKQQIDNGMTEPESIASKVVADVMASLRKRKQTVTERCISAPTSEGNLLIHRIGVG